jgi:hypothetical protein
MINKIKEKFSQQEILESLSRSGYLFESEITKYLVDIGFFVQSNIASLDPTTGKNREIDLFAEFYSGYDEERFKDKIVSLARFVFEIKNNDSPLVLMTRHTFSPNEEIYNGFKEARTIPDSLKNIYYSGYYEVLFLSEKEKKLFTQYCSFSKKKNEELMAHHPENVYSAFQKITYFCEEKIESWKDPTLGKDDYFRNILYLPVLLIKEDLYECEIIKGNRNKLKKVECSRLVFNYHFKDKPRTSIIYVVTKKGLKNFLKEILSTGKIVENNMRKSKLEMLKRITKSINA